LICFVLIPLFDIGGPSSEGPTNNASRQAPAASSPVVAFFGGGIGPTIGENWPPSRRREETTVLKNLEKRVGSFRVNLRTSFGHLLEREPSSDKDRLQPLPEKTEKPDVPDNRLPLLKKVSIELYVIIMFI